jgi:hypothetical protein
MNKIMKIIVKNIFLLYFRPVFPNIMGFYVGVLA